MRKARGKVVNGRIVTKAKFPDGTKLRLVVDGSEEDDLEDLLSDTTELRAVIRDAVAGALAPMQEFTMLLGNLAQRATETGRILQRRKAQP